MGTDGNDRAPTQPGESKCAPPQARDAETVDGTWLVRHIVGVPDSVAEYVERPDVEQRCALLERRLTVLHAPGGFGKTAVLTHCCQALRGNGVPVAWVSLNSDDGPDSLAANLALAFAESGLSTTGTTSRGRDAPATGTRHAEAHSEAEYRIKLLIQALSISDANHVLVLDEVERLRHPQALAVLNMLLIRAPINLHVGMAFREPPPGLEIAMFALEGRSRTLTAEDLRFKKPDIARFFGEKLSRRELGLIATESEGWPIALRIQYNARREATERTAIADKTVTGWIETRLWRGMPAADRDFVLDVALFDRVEPELIDEVTGAGNTARRIASLRALAGLLTTTPGRGSAMRLHGLVKSYCEQRRFEEDPKRYRAVQAGIARALARRGRAIEALQHAAEANDTDLLGRIAEDTGGVRLWLAEGLAALRALDRHLTEDVLSRHPRLALVRCVVLLSAGDVERAKRVYDAGAANTAGFTRDRNGNDSALRIDHVLVQGLIHMCGCAPYGDGIAKVIAVAETVAVEPDTEPFLRGMFSLGMCIAHNQTTAFEPSLEWAEYARAALDRGSPYLAHVDFHAGSVAMAQGRTRQAQRCYDRALTVAKATHLRDAGAVMIGEILAAELALERMAGTPRLEAPRVSPQGLSECSAWLDIYAASLGVAGELALEQTGPESALELVEDALEWARRTERPALSRFLCGLRVSTLLSAGDVEEAERAWRFDRLPSRDAACIELDRQSWREMEMLACARLRLFVEIGAFEAARKLAAALRKQVVEHGLVRTQMRVLALSMGLEQRAGSTDCATARLIEYLKLFTRAHYGRPLARDREVALELLGGVGHAAQADAAVVTAADRLCEAMRLDASAGDVTSHWPLTRREMDVLELLDRKTDKEIARLLNLSYEGVRSRIRGIFRKLGAQARHDAVHRARSRRILDPLETSSQAHG